MGFRARAAAMGLALLSFSPALAQETPVAEPDLAALYDALRAPTVLGSIPAPAKITVGNAEIRPASGTRLMVMGALGVPCGWFFTGPGALVYRVEDRFSIPIARRNLKRADRIDVSEAGGVLTLTTALRGAAVWGWGLELGEISPASGADLGPPEWLREIVARKLESNPERDMFLTRFNGDPGFRWALLHAAGDDFYLDHDPRPIARTESLVRFDKISSGTGDLSGRLSGEEMSVQPIARSWHEPAGFDLVSEETEIDLRNRREDHVQVTTNTRVKALRDGYRVLPFSLWTDRFDDDLRELEYRVSRLSLNGSPAPYLHREDVLYVLLPKPLGRGQSVALEVVTEGEILVRPASDSYWRLIGSWYPQPLGGVERAEIRITAEVLPPYLPIAGGELLERRGTETGNLVRTRLAAPMEMATVIAGKYTITTEEHDGDRVHVASYASVKEKEARRLARIMLAGRDCLEKWLDVDYPFEDLEVVEIKQWGWGQAPPGVIFITQEAFLTQASARVDDEREFIASFVSRGINERVTHEVAHAWFPHVAKITWGEDNWLSESLADYASAYCLAETMGGRDGKYHFKRQLIEWKDWSRLAGDDASVYLAAHLGNREKDWFTWQRLLYGRGPLVLHAIRQKLEKQHGEKKGRNLFLVWIRSYIANFTYKTAQTRHLIGILNQITGEDWQPFFDRHIYGTEPPEVD